MIDSGRSPAKLSALWVEAPLALLFLSTLVLRIRTNDQLASQPLDRAGIFRVACVSAACLLSASLFWKARNCFNWKSLRLPKALWAYALYALTVFAAVPFSVDPKLTLYRGLELLAGLFVVSCVWAGGGEAGIRRAEWSFYGFGLIMLVVVWAGAAISPGLAVIKTVAGSGSSVRLRGTLTQLSFDDVGMFSVVVALWSAARFSLTRLQGPRILYAIAGAFSVVTLVASQYRTGYIALAAGLVWVLALRSRRALLVMVVLTLLALALTGVAMGSRAPTLHSLAKPLLLRGQSVEGVGSLTGRTAWWRRALEVWKESPVFGKGLMTATRFEVLQGLGRDTTATIHNSWIEALLGTGVVGTFFLAISFLGAWGKVLREKMKYGTPVIAAVLMLALTIRALTGNSFESFSYWSLLYCFLVFGLPSPAAEKERLRMHSQVVRGAVPV